MCVCLTQMSSFSNFDIIVLAWCVYKCVCVYKTHVLVLLVKDRSPHLSVCVCLTQTSSFSKLNNNSPRSGAYTCVYVGPIPRTSSFN